jgi:tetratricopeptide (TPR) repeat protein
MLATLALCCALALAPEPGSMAEAEALFNSGQAKYETHDYAGAITDFTAAYNLALEFDDESQRDEVLARLAYNLARAHVSAYDVDADPDHLKLARRLAADYRGHERQMGRDPDADTDLQVLEADLLERERALKPEEKAPDEEPKPEPQPPPRGKRIAGISMLAIAPVFGGLAIGGGVMAAQARDDFRAVTTGAARMDAQQRGRVGDVLLGVGVGLAAASAITGVALIVSGRAGKNRKLAITIQPNGITLTGRF